VKLHHLRPAPGSKKKRIRVGRGESGRRGKTAGRGTKGQKARDNTKVGFEGGQTPLKLRLPKLKGFKNPFRTEYAVVNVGRLEEHFEDGASVGREELEQAGLLSKKKLPIKLLGHGELSKRLHVTVDACSAGARRKVEQAGGTVTELSRE
jgi:large subunit ribosomal protein L15